MRKAYEAVIRREQGGKLNGVTIPSTVAFAANAFELNNSLDNAFEALVRQRTQVLCSYKERLEKDNGDLLNRRKFGEAIKGVLKLSCRSTDIRARLGGDEFAVILPHTGAAAADSAMYLVKQESRSQQALVQV